MDRVSPARTVMVQQDSGQGDVAIPRTMKRRLSVKRSHAPHSYLPVRILPTPQFPWLLTLVEGLALVEEVGVG